jgi:hypothetical protein
MHIADAARAIQLPRLHFALDAIMEIERRFKGKQMENGTRRSDSNLCKGIQNSTH